MIRNSYLAIFAYTILIAIIGTIPLYSTQYTVSTSAQITSRMSTAQPGDTLRMTNGTWNNVTISFAGYGTAALPIVLRADTYGSVILSGTSTLSISGRNLVVDGLVFQNGYTASSPVISFQGTNGMSDSCRLTNCSIISYNPPDSTSDIDWVGLYGSHNRVDHNYFYGKTNLGVVVVVWCDTTKSDYHQIDHNYFTTRLPAANGSGGYMNGFETIRVGTGAYSTTNSYTVVENNLFYKCDGDAEFISNKSNGNTYRYNTFRSCQGMLSMRQGNNCTIQGNFILGNHATGYRGTGGIRLTGSNHVVYNNYVSGVDNNKAAAGLAFMDGTATGVSPSYPQVKNAIVVFNTFVDNAYSIALGVNNNGGTIYPDSCIIANNTVYTTISNPLISVYDSPTNLTWQGDIFYGGSTLGITKPSGITQTSPKLSLASDSLWRPSSSSPLIGAAASTSSYSYVTDDMDGQTRDAAPDVGADEYSAATITRKPLTATDVGPTYLATAEPTTQASSIVISSITGTSATLSCAAGNGAQRIFVVHAGSAVTSGPSDYTTYTANSAFGSGTQIGTGNYVVYSGSGTSVTITGLSSATTYYVNVYEFNGSGGAENYLTTSPATANWTTLTVEPTVQASGVSFSSISATSITVSCTVGNGAQRIFLIHSGSAVSSTPTDNTTYTASSVYGSGTQIGSGNYVIYKGSGTSVTVTGLTAGTTYYVSVCEFNGSSGTENYLITSPATGNATTLATEPTTQASSVVFSSITATSVTLSCTKGNGARRIILLRAGSAVNSNPVDYTTYTANSVFGSGTLIGSSNYVVYKDTGSSVTITGLSASTTYYAKVYELNGTVAGTENYLTTSPAAGNTTTSVAEPTTQTSGIVFSSIAATSFSISCTKGNGARRIILLHAGSAVDSDPADNTTYTANSVFGSGTQIGSGNYVVYKDTGSTVAITGLTANTTYYAKIYEFNGTGGTENFLTTNPAAGNTTTLAAEPTTQTSGIQFTSIASTSFTVSCSKGNGAGRIILIHAGSTVSSDPVDNTAYTASAVFGSGTQIGSGNYVAYKDTGSSVTITGLSASTTYYVKIYEFNGSSGTENYLTTNPASGNATTLIGEPTTQASAITFSAISSTSFSIGCTKGSGSQRIILVHAGSSVNSDPVDNTTYTASAVFGSGTQIGTGNYVVYKDTGATVTVTGLSANTTYYVGIYEFNGTSGGENYLITNPASGSTTTLLPEPTIQASGVQFSSITSTTFTLSCSKGNGTQRIMLLHSGSSVNSDPVDNTTYSANSVFGSGTQIGSGNYVVYKDTGSTVTITGLSANTLYYVKVYELNGSGGTENYLTASPAANSATTLPNVIHTNGAGGNWSSSGSWVGGAVPGINDNAVVDSGATVVLDADATVYNLTVSASGTLSISSTRTVNGAMTIYGALSASGTNTITVTGNITCSGASASLKLSSANTVISGVAGKTFTLSNGALFQTSNNSNPFTGSMVNFTWVIDNSAALTSVIIKNSGVTSIVNPPNSQVIGNLQLTCASSGNNKTFSLGENINIAGELTIADGNTVTTPTNCTTWYNITTSGTGKSVSVTQAASGTVLLIKGTGSTLFNGFSSCSFIPPANASCTVTYAGTSQTIAGGQYQNLADSSGGAKALAGNVSVGGNLILANGTISLGAYNLTLSGAISGAFTSSNMIIASDSGELRKVFSSVPSSFTFPVGTESSYSPVVLALTGGTLSSAYIGVKVSAAKSSANASTTNYLNRYWTLTSNGITNPVHTDTLYYTTSDISGSEAGMVGGLYTGSAWVNTGAVNVTNHYISASSLSAFGIITAGESSAFASSGQVSVYVIPQGRYNSGGFLNSSDTIHLYLASTISPYSFIDSTLAVLDSINFNAIGTFSNSQNGNYYLVVRHRNSVETWSSTAISYSNGLTSGYNFTDAQSKAYGDNQIQVSTSPVEWAIYSGDVNQDGYVDPLDLSLVDQDSYNYVSGFALATDINGDHYVDPLDLSLVDQNSFLYVGVQKPLLAGSQKQRKNPITNQTISK